MDLDFSNFVSDLWQNHPVVVILSIGAILLFVLFLVDTLRHRRKLKERHRIKPH